MTTREALMQRIEQTFDANCGKHPEHVAKRLEDICWQVDQWAREDSAARIAELEAQVAVLHADREKMWKARFMVSQALHNVMVGNQSAWIEWQHGAGAEEAMAWIHNGLVGPGLIPKDAHAITAQAWFDANQDDRYEVPPAPALPASPVSKQG